MVSASIMNSRVASILHLFPPQRQHVQSTRSSASHPVCFEFLDYCCKIDRQHPTQIPLSTARLPVVSFLPKSTERLVFDEIVADSDLFANLHAPGCVQEVELLLPKETLDNIACEVIAGAHHAQSRLIISHGAVGSGHGQLSFGSMTSVQTPEVGIVWSLLDSIGQLGEWPKISAFQVERTVIRDLLAEGELGEELKPRTRQSLLTIEALRETGIIEISSSVTAKQKLAIALHQKRRTLAKWHAIDQVVDRNGKSPRLKSVYTQVGQNNYQMALDCCGSTFVLLQLGPERDFSTILLIDMPAYAHTSPVADYTPTQELFDVQKQSAAIKNALQFGKRDHLAARVIIGLAPSCFSPDCLARDRYIFTSAQVSDVERQQTHSVLRLAAQYDSFVAERYFDAFRAEERRRGVVRRFEEEKTIVKFEKQAAEATRAAVVESPVVEKKDEMTVSQLKMGSALRSLGPKIQKIQKSVKAAEILRELEEDVVKPEEVTVKPEPELSIGQKTAVKSEIQPISFASPPTGQRSFVGKDQEVRDILSRMSTFLKSIKE